MRRGRVEEARKLREIRDRRALGRNIESRGVFVAVVELVEIAAIRLGGAACIPRESLPPGTGGAR